MNTPLTLAQSLQRAQSMGLARIDAQLLHLHALGRDPHDRAWLLAHDTDILPAAVAEQLEVGLQRRVAGEPIAYITGFKAFFGLNLQVDARVLDPRPDTETLVEWALERLPPDTPQRVLDLGTGSGAVALALQHERPTCQVTAVDASADALAVASANAQRLGLPVQCVLSHWMDAVPGPFELIVSNPPYVADGDPHLADAWMIHGPGVDVQGRDVDSFVKDANAAIQAKVKMPTGYWVEWGGAFENQQRAMERLARVDGLTAAGFSSTAR